MLTVHPPRGSVEAGKAIRPLALHSNIKAFFYWSTCRSDLWSIRPSLIVEALSDITSSLAMEVCPLHLTFVCDVKTFYAELQQLNKRPAEGVLKYLKGFSVFVVSFYFYCPQGPNNFLSAAEFVSR